MEIKQLEYFRAIVEAGSISGAARALHMTQPPLSYQIKMLEEELQVSLFLRGVNITVQMYPCSEGTDTGSPALGYRESGTGIPHFVTCEFTRLLPDPSRILHAWICNSPDPSG